MGGMMNNYYELVRLCESTYRTFLGSIKDALFNLNIKDVNAGEAVLVLNLGDHEIKIRDFIRCGYYKGTNVTHSLDSLVKNGYMVSKENPQDKRSRVINLSEKGMKLFNELSKIINKHNKMICISEKDDLSLIKRLQSINNNMKLLISNY